MQKSAGDNGQVQSATNRSLSLRYLKDPLFSVTKSFY